MLGVTLRHLSGRELGAASAIGATALLVTGTGVLAAANATAFNLTAEPVSSAHLSLALANVGAGFSAPVTDLAPGDVVNRFVTVTNDGTLPARDLTLQVTETGTANPLTADATKGLFVRVTRCSVAWTVNATTGACAGTATDVTPPAGRALSGFGTLPVLTGPIPTGAKTELRIAVLLPDNTEVTINGLPPAGSVQNLTASLRYTFTQTQRAAVEKAA